MQTLTPCVETPMLRLAIKSTLLVAILGFASLFFAEALVVSALILVTVTVTAVALVIGPTAELDSPAEGVAGADSE